MLVDGTGQGEVFQRLAGTLFLGTASNRVEEGIVHVNGGTRRGAVSVDDVLAAERESILCVGTKIYIDMKIGCCTELL